MKKREYAAESNSILRKCANFSAFKHFMLSILNSRGRNPLLSSLWMNASLEFAENPRWESPPFMVGETLGFSSAILLASALSFSALASDINNIRYINALSGSQLVLNGVVNITQGLNVSDGLIVRSGNVGIR